MAMILVDTAQTIAKLDLWLMELKNTEIIKGETEAILHEIIKLRKKLLINSEQVLKELKAHLTVSEWRLILEKVEMSNTWK